MLNLDNKSTYMVVISEAQVQLTNGEKVVADYVEYFYRDGSLKGFVFWKVLCKICCAIFLKMVKNDYGRL